MTALALLGALGGAGLLVLLRGLLRVRHAGEDSLAPGESLEALAEPRGTASRRRRAGLPGVLVAAGSAVDAWAVRVGWPLARDEDLALLGRSREQHLQLVGLASIGSSACCAAASGALSLVVPQVGTAIVAGAAVAGLLFGVLVPALCLRRQASRARTHFVRGLSTWLDLVTMAQAGGMGIEGALHTSAEAISDRTFIELRLALERSRLAASAPWTALAVLGRSIGVHELEELAATLGLAGSEGARVRASLVAKASGLRCKLMTEQRAEANATTERLFLPSILLMCSFLLFLIFPAGARLGHLF